MIVPKRAAAHVPGKLKFPGRVLAMLLAVPPVVVPARSGDATSSWTCITTLGPGGCVQVDPRGRLWRIRTPDTVGMWSIRESGWPSLEGEEQWTEFRMPSGYLALQVNATAGDEIIVVAARYGTKNRQTVLRRGIGSPGDAWTEDVPPHVGVLFGPRPLPDGSVWIGGERREVFRWDGRAWAKEMTGRPLHNKQILSGGNGVLWAVGHAHRDRALFRRDGEGWRTLREWRGPVVFPLWCDEERCIIRVGDDLEMCHADGRSARRLGAIPATASVALDSDRTAWVVAEGELLRWEDGKMTPRDVVPCDPLEIFCVDSTLVAVEETACWAYLPAARTGFPDTVPMGLKPIRPPRNQIPWPHGAAVLPLRDSPCLYVATHEVSDLILPLGRLADAVHWREISADFGLGDPDEDPVWTYSYETAAAAADLNGDGTEDVVLATMYDGVRMLRNVGNRRFVGWTRESGLGGDGMDVTVDVDLLDADRDGDLDVFVSTMQGSDRLYLNNGSASFRQVHDASGMAPGEGSAGAGVADLDGDGDTDIAVVTVGRGLILHENVGESPGSCRFRTRVPFTDANGASSGYFGGVGFADFDLDGLPEVVVSGATESARFFWNRGGMSFEEDPAMFPGDAPRGGGSGVDCFDADGDGDPDVFVTGSGGARIYENRGRLAWSKPTDWNQRFALGRPNSSGSVVVDADEDGDLDWIELASAGTSIRHSSSASGERTVVVDVRGPRRNRSAVGARVAVREEGGSGRFVQEVSGGSGSGSHRTKLLHFTGLDPERTYSVEATLPSGETRSVTGVRVPATAVLDLHEGSLTALLAGVGRGAGLVPGDYWGRRWLILTIAASLATLAVMLIQRRSVRVPHGIAAVASVPVAAALVRWLMASDPGALPVVVSSVAGLAIGSAVLAVAPRRPDPTTLEALADVCTALQVFRHNETPRKVLDNLLLVLRNAGSGREGIADSVRALLREDLDLFTKVVAPQVRELLRTARAAGFDTAGAEAAAERLDNGVRPGLSEPPAGGPAEEHGRLRALEEDARRILAWTRTLSGEVDARVATPLDEAVARFVESRGRVHPVRFEQEVQALLVRFPAVELDRILDILLENTVKARPDAGIRIDSRLLGRERVRLRFCDDGPGIDPEIARRIFEPTFTRFRSGSGFGLFYARKAVERFGGQLSLAEGPLSGACLALDLPVVRVHGEPGR